MKIILCNQIDYLNFKNEKMIPHTSHHTMADIVAQIISISTPY
jgi:hypothetical protein